MKRLFELTVSEFTEILKENTSQQSIVQPEKKWVSRKEACEKLNVSFPTLHKYINEGMLTKHKVGAKTFLASSDIENLISNGKIR